MAKDKRLSYRYLKAHPPMPGLITAALEGAHHIHSPDQSEWELVLIPIKHLNPTEEAEDEVDENLLAQMKFDPASLPPILVSGQGNSYDIVDGHHRYQAARVAGVGWIWALNGEWFPA